MKYLCLIYDDEKQWAEMPKEVQDKYMGEYTAFGESIRKSGKYVGANQLQPSHTATDRARRATARSRRPMGPSSRRRSSSVATTSSRRRI